MRKLQITVLTVLGLGIAVLIGFFLIGYLKPKAAGLYIETKPASLVYLNGVQAGRTPYRDTKKPSELVVKLVPESFDVPLPPYETRVNLVDGVETVIRWEFGESEEFSGGEIISFEKISKGDVGLAVVTIPESAQISIDNRLQDYAPYKTSALSQGNHTITLTAKGYNDKTIGVKTHNDYQLTALVKLSKSEDVVGVETDEIENEEEEKKEIEITVIKILSTSVGFLRVREGPSTLEKEIGKVEPDEEYVLVEEDEETGWYKIEIDDETLGWVSNQYSEKTTKTVSSEEKEEGELITTPTP